ncbi:hypothetical protein H0W32_00600 [Patescibacteria group bacterium]|nr:hypothetical protein [Patescibacteria group bacterium]
MEQTQQYFNNIGDVTVASLKTAWFEVLQYLPTIIGAILILFIGWIIAIVLGSLVQNAVKLIGLDETIERTGINQKLRVTGQYKLLSGMLGKLTKWFIILITLIAIANTFNLPQVTQFLNAVALYIPRVIVAVIILVIGMLLSDFVARILSTGINASKLPVRHRTTIISVARYAIIVFSIMAALVQLNIVPALIEILFAGLVLALALAFGLGGREEAARFLASLRTEK